MNEKYLSSLGAGLILISFGIIISFFVVSGIENKAAEQNTTINFEQLGELNADIKEKLQNNTVSEEFRKFVGKTVDKVKNKVLVENGTLNFELKNKKSVNRTD